MLSRMAIGQFPRWEIRNIIKLRAEFESQAENIGKGMLTAGD